MHDTDNTQLNTAQ